MTTPSACFSPVAPLHTDALGWIKEDHAAALTKELKDYLKCVKNNVPRFLAITDFGAICGSSLDPGCCKPVDKKMIQHVLHDFIALVSEGGFKINGKRGDWSVGFLGNRWLDMDAKSYAVDYIRVAFYSKKHYDGVWPHEKPYNITITVEKAK
jgi:hypothetical protein